MQEHRQHHHLLPLKKEEEKKKPVEAVVYSETAFGVDHAGKPYETTETVAYTTTQPDYQNGRKAPQLMEHLGGLGNVAPGTFALYEKHQATKDEVNQHRNKIEEKIATAAALGAGGYAFR